MILHGILLIDKPQGWTSHDVVAKTRRLIGQKKIGHTGTLDPMATGLLVLCLGDATRLVEYMTAHDKAYEGEITLGVRTATDDAEGEAIETRPIPELQAEDLARLAAKFTGDIMQRPPAFSAVKLQGERAYAAARKGKAIELAPRPVRIDALELTQTAPGKLRIRVECGAGTYIRSLARDIGEMLGCGAHLSALRRTRAGRFRVEDAAALPTVEALAAAGCAEELLWAPDEGIAGTPAAVITAANGLRFAQGNAILTSFEKPITAVPLRVYDVTGTFLGIATGGLEGQIRPLKVLASSIQ